MHHGSEPYRPSRRTAPVPLCERPAPSASLAAQFRACSTRSPSTARHCPSSASAPTIVRARATPSEGAERPHKHEAPACARASWSTSSVSRVLFRSEVTRAAAANHSSRTTVTGRLEQPTRELGRAVLRCSSEILGGSTPAYVALLPMGSTSPSPLPETRWALTPPFHPYPAGALARAGQAVCSLLHFPWRSRHRALPGIVLCGARTFLPSRCLPACAGRPRTGDRLYGVDRRRMGPSGAFCKGKVDGTLTSPCAASGRTRAPSRTGRRRCRTGRRRRTRHGSAPSRRSPMP